MSYVSQFTLTTDKHELEEGTKPMVPLCHGPQNQKRVSLTRVVTGSREKWTGLQEILSKWYLRLSKFFEGLTGEGVEVMKNDSTVSGLNNCH